MILYMSGGELEVPLQKVGIKEVSLMMSFYPSSKGKPEKRFLKIVKSRKRKLKKRSKK